MPQICHFIGVNSVTNIEPPTGFMPVLIYVFADWLEKILRLQRSSSIFAQACTASGLKGARPIAIWPFALKLKVSSCSPIYEYQAT